MAKTKLTKKQLVDALEKLKVEDIPAGATQPQLTEMLKKAQEDNAKIKDENKDKDTETEAGDTGKGTDEGKADEKRITPDDESEEDEGAEDEEKDYLRKFQFGKDDKGPFPIGDKRSDPADGSKADLMKKQLLKQKRISILIPVHPGDDPKYPQSVTLNGYRLDFPRNTYLDVPKQIAELIKNSQNQQTEALEYMRIDRKEDVEKALS